MTDLAAMLATLRKAHADSLTLSIFNTKTRKLEDVPLTTPFVMLPSPVLAAFLDVAEAYAKARGDLLREPLLHGDPGHRGWLSEYLTAHFAAADEALSRLAAAEVGP